VVKGNARLWTTGHVALNPRSKSAIEPIVEGYLSVEIVGKGNQALWSYLVTPSKFPWNGVSDDLAKQLVVRLLAAIQESAQPATSGETSQATTKATLKGAGATFPAPLYQSWFQQFEESHPGVSVGYDAVGSAEGIRLLKLGRVDFGASEIPSTDDSASENRRGYKYIPMVVGAVVPIYNIEGLRRRLNFTPEILAAIYLGKLKKWNDAKIRKANPGATLPDAEIAVVHRSDGSGTTFVWSDYLSKVSPEWKTSVGHGDTVRWPIGAGAEHNEGVASTVQQTPNSIGYVEFIYAIQHELSFGVVRNAAGEFIKADLASVAAAARDPQSTNQSTALSITNSPAKDAYPIATYTWLLLPERTENKDKRGALDELARWMLTSGQKSCSALGYVPLPGDAARRALQAIE
jgi:phosphate transport system substrate-binding protein